jgi:hypothetical protein
MSGRHTFPKMTSPDQTIPHSFSSLSYPRNMMLVRLTAVLYNSMILLRREIPVGMSVSYLPPQLSWTSTLRYASICNSQMPIRPKITQAAVLYNSMVLLRQEIPVGMSVSYLPPQLSWTSTLRYASNRNSQMPIRLKTCVSYSC